METRPMYKKKVLVVVMVMAMASVALAASGLVLGNMTTAERADCPGKITCPLTGDPVCLDRCPVGAKQIKVESKQASCCLVKNKRAK